MGVVMGELTSWVVYVMILSGLIRRSTSFFSSPSIIAKTGTGTTGFTSSISSFRLISSRSEFHPDITSGYKSIIPTGEVKSSLYNDEELCPILVSIEGNIGAGKTTLLSHLSKRHPEWIFISEPVDAWSEIKDEDGKSILEVFYNDRNRWSYTFQNCALLTRYDYIQTAISEAKSKNRKGKVVFLTERCLDTDYYVFTRMLQNEGSINIIEFELYERLLFHLQKSAQPLAGIVHVNTSPEVCAQRIKLRSRTGEESIPLDYLESLDHHQSKWIDSTDLPSIRTDLIELKPIEDFIVNLLK